MSEGTRPAYNGDELFPLKVAVTFLLVGFVVYLALEFLLFWPSSFSVFWGEIWGRAVLIDLYLMLLLAGGWAVYRESKTRWKIIWPVLFFATGSIGVLVYILKVLAPLKSWSEMPRFFLGPEKELN
ncbi:MAG: hypothetical protein JJU11_06820 [Candidatus Sumerlaeia bacterium]|nr:hypothetical protein [Candidatus Sumerlaeia bacterium]